MRMKLNYSGLVAIGLIVVSSISSCKDDPAPSKAPMLAKTWKVAKYELNGVEADRDACETDNTTTFHADGTYIDATGPVTCDEFDTDVEGTWAFKANETILTIHPSGDDAQEWKIVELSETRLTISQHVQLINSDVTFYLQPN